MGFFSKLKADMNHGGVTLSIQAPGSIPSNQPIPVTVTVTSQEPRTIHSITVELQSQEQAQGVGVGMGNGVGFEDSETSYSTIGQVENRDQFTISPGESRTVNLQLYANNNPTNMLNQFGNTPVGGAIGGLVNFAARSFQNVHFNYRIHASADVEGVGIGPAQHVAIQLEPPAANNITPTSTPGSDSQPQPGTVPTATQPLPPTNQS